MRIGIDGLPLTELLTGIGHYTLELAQHLASNSDTDSVQVVSPRSFVASLQLQTQATRNLQFVRARVGPISRRWWSIGLPRYVRRHGIELFHGTNFEVPLGKVCPTVLTIHDLSMLLHPQTQEKRLVRRAQRRFRTMARAATMIVTPTQTVRDEIHEHLQIPLDRIVVVSEAARRCFRPLELTQTAAVRTRFGIRDEFLLFVGTVEPRKNLNTLLKAFEHVIQTRGRPVQLVITGRKGWLVDDLLHSLKRSPAAKQLTLTGYLSDEDLSALYSACSAFVYPSIYEGFGLPPLEAMACGAPVIASRIPSIEEVTGSAARLVDPESAPDLARAITDVLESETTKAGMSSAGIARAKEFSWSQAADLTRQVYGDAIQRFYR